MLPERKESTLMWLLKVQVALIALTSLAAGMLAGLSEGLSVFAGGLVAWLPNTWFALRFVRTRAGTLPKEILNRFYTGEAFKLALTAVLFFCALQIPNVKPLLLMAGFIIALSAFWFALLRK